MSFAEEAGGGPAQRGRPRLLEVVYYALAAFDIVTIVLTLLLSNYTMTLYRASVHRSEQLGALVHTIVELSGAAQRTNAPGNMVFTTRDVAGEEAARDAALERYHALQAQALSAEQISIAGDYADAIRDHLTEARAYMDAMIVSSDALFADLARGEDEVAARRMSEMDAIYGDVSFSLLQAVNAAQAAEDSGLQRDVRVAGAVRAVEFVILGFVFVIVIAVTIYGRRIGMVMQRAESDLKAANRRLEQYADNVAHELRNPVNKMLLASELALARPRSAEQYREALASVVDESKQLSEVVGSLLFLARATDSGAITERVNLAEELPALEREFGGAARDAGVGFFVERKELWLRADRELLRRALSNLVKNAIAHTPAGGEVRVAVEEGAETLTITVSDTGAGIAEEDQARVFERFYQSSSPLRGPDGLGLGLPIVRRVMDLHGGRVGVASRAGEGARMSLIFPN